jgi:peptidoglycan lytic transglycosylase
MELANTRTERRRTRVGISASIGVAVYALALASCAGSTSESRFPPSYTGTSASPRIWNGYGAPPERRGNYKLGAPYQVAGKTFVPRHNPSYDEVGTASWYGSDFQGRLTSNGEVYDMNRLSGAHPTLPLPSLVRVTNLENGRSIVVRINDRGPFVRDRIIDLSKAAAERLGFHSKGTARVRVTYVGLAALDG